MIEQNDSRNSYCRMLGHSVPFQYCRTVRQGIPCSRILDCWFEVLPIQEFIDKHYTAEQKQRILSPQKSKIETIADIVSRIEQRNKSDSNT